MDGNKGYQVYKGVASDPNSVAGQELLKKALGFGEIKSFPFSISAGIDRSPDYHSVDCVVFVEGGILEIGFGESYEDKVRVEKGDYLFIRKDAPHLERAVGEESVSLTIFYIGDFRASGVS